MTSCGWLFRVFLGSSPSCSARVTRRSRLLGLARRTPGECCGWIAPRPGDTEHLADDFAANADRVASVVNARTTQRMHVLPAHLDERFKQRGWGQEGNTVVHNPQDIRALPATTGRRRVGLESGSSALGRAGWPRLARRADLAAFELSAATAGRSTTAHC